MLYLHGLGHFHPTNEITNQFLEELDIGCNDAWISQRTGIRSRRTVLSLDYIKETKNQDVRACVDAIEFTNAELGRRAAEKAIERAEIDRSDIGLVICGGCVPETVIPAEACNVAAELNIDAPAFDVRSACTSFGAALFLAERLKEDWIPDYVLIVMPETVTRSVNYSDRRTAVLWGDAAAAVVVSTRLPSRATIECNIIASNPKGHGEVVVPWAGHFDQNGSAVYKFSVKTTIKLLRRLQKQYEKSAGDRFHFIGHQANLRMLNSVSTSCKIPKERHHYNVTDYGNTASAGSPSVLSSHWDSFESGDHVAIIGVGSGLTWTDSMVCFSG